MEKRIDQNKIGYLNNDFKVFHIKDKRCKEFEYHYHDFNKIIFFISGKVAYLIEGKTYNLKPYDVLFVSSSEVHKPIISPDETYERIIIWVNPEFLERLGNGCDLMSCFKSKLRGESNLIRLNPDFHENIKCLFKNLSDEASSSKFGSTILYNALFIELMVLLNRICLDSKDSFTPDDIKYNENIKKIINYINSNLTEDLSIENISQRFFVNKYYLMHNFKAQTGYSLHNYITQKRLINAKSLIKKGCPVTEACIESGFNDYSSFVRAFKSLFGQPPKAYKGQLS